MENRALGMIEVRGMLGAIEAADAALKAASVSLLRISKVGAGLITVLIVGDVAAVRSAVDAAVASLSRLGRNCSSHVIPRLTPEVFVMIGRGRGRSGGRSSTDDTCGDAAPDSCGEPECRKEEVVAPAEEDEPDDEQDEENEEDDGGNAGWSGDIAGLDSLTVMELRRLARNAGLRSLTKKEIRFAGKSDLIRELTAFFESSGGEGE